MSSQAPRKIVFIDKKFQTGFALKFIALLLVGTALFDIAAYFVLNRKLGETLWSAHLTIKSVGEMLLPTLVYLSLVFIILLGLAVLVMSLFMSHYIAGPLYAIRRYIELIGEGRLDFDAKLRSKDQTAPLIVTLSDSLDVLNDRITNIQALGEDLRNASGKLQDGIDRAGSVPDDIRSGGARIAELESQLSKEAGFFRTRPPKTPA